jgi:hypothetical protein
MRRIRNLREGKAADTEDESIFIGTGIDISHLDASHGAMLSLITNRVAVGLTGL